MVRFKVVRASRLLLAVAIGIFLLVGAALVLKVLLDSPGTVPSSNASLVEAGETEEAKTSLVFASSSGSIALPRDAPRILIYHTHTHEAYAQVVEDPYDAVEAWRTTDAGHSVVRVGAELARRLRAFGMDVTHDVTDHEGSELSTAYTRSLQTLEGYSQPFDLYIDLHRDACEEGAPTDRAELMLLIGNGEGFDEKPYYTQNLAFAKALTEEINAVSPGACKGVLVKDGRYNQHVGVFSVLVEVGHNRNTLAQALDAVTPLAEGIRRLLVAAPRPELAAMHEKWMSERS